MVTTKSYLDDYVFICVLTEIKWWVFPTSECENTSSVNCTDSDIVMKDVSIGENWWRPTQLKSGVIAEWCPNLCYSTCNCVWMIISTWSSLAYSYVPVTSDNTTVTPPPCISGWDVYVHARSDAFTCILQIYRCADTCVYMY